MKSIKTIPLLIALLSTPLYASVFWNQQAVDAGYELPPTYGFSIIGAYDNENVSADNLSLTVGNDGFFKDEGQSTLGGGMKAGGFFVKNVEVKTTTKLARFDVWLFPFLNVYVVGGRTDGRAAVTTDMKDWDAVEQFFSQYGVTKQMDFNVEFGGKTYGGGAVLAGGYKNFFTVVNYTYVKTKLDMLSGSVMAESVSATVGYKIMPNLKVWTGAMYLNIDQKITGPIPAGMVPPNPYGSDVVGTKSTFEIAARASHTVNPLIGAQYTIMNKVDLTLEGTVGHRQAVTAMVTYRF